MSSRTLFTRALMSGVLLLAAAGTAQPPMAAALLQAALWVGRWLGLTAYGPEQLRFLRYRPVLDNRRLKQQFGYTPAFTSTEAFDRWWAARRVGDPKPAP